MLGSKLRKARRTVELAMLETRLAELRAETERRRRPDYCSGCVRMEMSSHPGMSEREAIVRVRERRTRPALAGVTVAEANANLAHNLGRHRSS